MPVLDYFIEHRRRLWPIVPLSFCSITAAADINTCVAIPGVTPLLVFTSDHKLYFGTAANPIVFTEITAHATATAISADSGSIQDRFTIAFINGTFYFSHNGKGPLRKFAVGATTYYDVAAPSSGYHSGNKYKPYYLATHANRLLMAGDTGTGGTVYDVVWSVVASPEDFVSFGAGYSSMYDTPDVLTGVSVLFNRIILYKSDSIIIGTATGDALAPYNWERYQHGIDQGIGNMAPYSLASDGTQNVFFSRVGIVSFNGSSHQLLGNGVEDNIYGGIALYQASAVTATIGAITGKAGATLPTGNHPNRFYAVSMTRKPIYLLNLDTGGWSKMSLGADNTIPTAIGTAFTGYNVKSIVIGSSGKVMVPCVVDGSEIMPTGIQPQIKIPPAIFGEDGKRKTVSRIGASFEVITGVNHSLFPISVSVDTEGATGTVTSQTLYPATNPSLTGAHFAWLDARVTGYCPAPLLKYPAGDGATARHYPQISSLTVQYALGDDR